MAWGLRAYRMLALATKDTTCRISISLQQQRNWGLWPHVSNKNLQDSPLAGDLETSAESTQLSFHMRSRRQL